MSLPPEYEGGPPLPITNDFSEPKRHAACDECSKVSQADVMQPSLTSLLFDRKAEAQMLWGNYQVVRDMGRPPKKRTRTDDEGVDPPALSGAEVWPSPEDSQQSSLVMSPYTVNFSDIDHLCPQLYWRPGTATNTNLPQSQSADLLSGYEDHNHTWRPDRLKQQNLPVPASSSPWPDFAAISEASAMPMPYPQPSNLPLHALPPTFSCDLHFL
ncbi:hypothetical protein N7453_011345 [Penicillium expansum]|nr:hypothetical protein N7453_011345 [Penicillium expansum]